MKYLLLLLIFTGCSTANRCNSDYCTVEGCSDLCESLARDMDFYTGSPYRGICVCSPNLWHGKEIK